MVRMAGGRSNKEKISRPQTEQGSKQQEQPHTMNPQPKQQRQQPHVDSTCVPALKGNGRSSRRPTNKHQRESNPVANGSNFSRSDAIPAAKERRPSSSALKQSQSNAGKKPERKENFSRVKSEGGIPIALAIASHRKNNHGKIKHSPNCLASIQMRLQKLNNLDKIQLVPVPVSFFKSNMKLAVKGSAKIQKDLKNDNNNRGHQISDRITKKEEIPSSLVTIKASIDPPSSIISGVVTDGNYLTIYEKSGSGQHQFPFMQAL